MENGNNILTIHSEWLRNNGFIKEANECLKQAQQHFDLRQMKGRKKYEATKLHASSNRVGNAYRVSRLKRA